MKIKAYVGYNERRNARIYQMFEVVQALPIIGEEYNRYGGNKVVNVYECDLDCENRNEEVFEYEFYTIVTVNDEGEEFYEYECVRKPEEEVEEEEEE